MTEKVASPRRRLLDLAPLELDCMNTLWPIGQATVREIRDLLAPRRPRAYTTIMTIMDRLARKGVVERVKTGRAYVYRPRMTVDDARAGDRSGPREFFWRFEGSAGRAPERRCCGSPGGGRSCERLERRRRAFGRAAGCARRPGLTKCFPLN